jgi:hypothetical protein
METELVMGCLNPRWFSSINTYDSHTNYNSFHEPTNASSFSPPHVEQEAPEKDNGGKDDGEEEENVG